MNTWLGNSADWQTGQNWSRSASPVSTDWVVIPSSPSGGNIPVLGSDAAVRNLEIQPGANMDIGTHTLTVEDTLINNGVLRQTKNSVLSGSTTNFLNITNASGAQLKYLGLEITPTSGPMGSTTV